VRPCPRPEPNPCAQTEDATQTSASQAAETGAQCESAAKTPAQQLERLRKDRAEAQREFQRYETLKGQIADWTQRIQDLEQAVEGQPAADAAYTDFYRAIEVYAREVDCVIPTVRCQLTINEKQKSCIRKAIAAVDARVQKAQAERDAQNALVRQLEAKLKKLEADLAWAAKWHNFFKTDLKTQVERQRDDLRALKALADPSKDQCEVWFYLIEMETMLRSARKGEGEACYREDLNLATFLDCWSPKCYSEAHQHWIVTFNDAESAAKRTQSELDEAMKHAGELDKLAKEAETKRREWILKELKVQDCCGPLSICP